MNGIEHLVLELLDAVVDFAPAPGAALAITEARIDVPIEARIDASGAVLASTPRGRLRTGFDVPHGRMTASFALCAPDAGGGR